MFYNTGPCWGATTFNITTLNIMTVSIKTLSITGLFVTLSIKGLFVTLSIMAFSINDTQHNSTLSVIMLNVAFDLLLC